MDRSLIFFYTILSFIIIYFTITFIKEKNKLPTLAFVFLIALNSYIFLYFSIFASEIWLILTAAGTLLSVILSFTIFYLIKQYLTSKHLDSRINQLRQTSCSDLVNQLIADHKAHQWYVLYIASNNTLEIGINTLNTNPVIGRKFYIKTLTKRYIYLIPEHLSFQLTGNENLICLLKDFYNLNNQSKTLIDDYILRIKTDVKEPWIISDNYKHRDLK
ncbi:hypothetical protein BHS62_26045 [Salmonella enterica]|nr:hypothetical protein [Salmonella enterica]